MDSRHIAFNGAHSHMPHGRYNIPRSLPQTYPPLGIEGQASYPQASNKMRFYVQRPGTDEAYVPLIALDEFPENSLKVDHSQLQVEPCLLVGRYERPDPVCQISAEYGQEGPHGLNTLEKLLKAISHGDLSRIIGKLGFKLVPTQISKIHGGPIGPHRFPNRSWSSVSSNQGPHQTTVNFSPNGTLTESGATPNCHRSFQEPLRTDTLQRFHIPLPTRLHSDQNIIPAPVDSRKSKALTVNGSRQVSGDSKIWCNYWIQRGECAFMQQGCKYRHEMPDAQTLDAIGFKGVPYWYREKERKKAQTPWQAAAATKVNGAGAMWNASIPTQFSSILATDGPHGSGFSDSHRQGLASLHAGSSPLASNFQDVQSPRLITGVGSPTPSPRPNLQTPILPTGINHASTSHETAWEGRSQRSYIFSPQHE
ncbi:MAG: hypothetical protein M1814_002665 [Vezdaea aestivalis]|nr:MAG: hypothetical protein M1814_002665 [Vezdaea aestivalis]